MTDHLAAIVGRSNDGKQGYADAFHGLTATAADWQQEGRSFAEFVSWMQATAPLVGQPSWKTAWRP
jgi:hypothetical protein